MITQWYDDDDDDNDNDVVDDVDDDNDVVDVDEMMMMMMLMLMLQAGDIRVSYAYAGLSGESVLGKPEVVSKRSVVWLCHLLYDNVSSLSKSAVLYLSHV